MNDKLINLLYEFLSENVDMGETGGGGSNQGNVTPYTPPPLSGKHPLSCVLYNVVYMIKLATL